jgi:neuropeptide Y receptor
MATLKYRDWAESRPDNDSRFADGYDSHGGHYGPYSGNLTVHMASPHDRNFSGTFNDTMGFLGPDAGLSQEQIENLLKQDSGSMESTFDQPTQIILIVAFAALILFGAAGNGLVCYVVAKNPNMRTPRNIFIINLAISDLTLCLFTQPFNLMKVSMHVWFMGDFMCKFIPMFSGTNVFVSTISITAIALDRFQVIVYPTKDSMKKVGVAIALISIWIISMLMASPLLIFNETQSVEVMGYVLYDVCLENTDLHYEKGAYSIASMIFQYIVPIVIVTVAHARICNKLKYRMVNQQPQIAINSPFQKRKSEREAKRKRKTNMLLIMIGVVFVLAWMPLNVCNIIADFNQKMFLSFDKSMKGLVIPICHLLVLSSACTNPVLYGWLNDNFKREFMNILCSPCCKNIRVLCPVFRCCACCRDGGASANSQTSVVIYTKANHGTASTCTNAAGVGTSPNCNLLNVQRNCAMQASSCEEISELTEAC